MISPAKCSPQTINYSVTASEITRRQLGWRMAVLPFRSVGARPGLGIALGMAEEISAALSRLQTPRLVATASFWDGSGPAVDALARCRAYQLDYVIDGTIEVIDQLVEVRVSLLDVVFDFEVVWTGHFDGLLDNLFELQHRIALQSVAQVDPNFLLQGRGPSNWVTTEVGAAHRSVLTAIQSIFRLDRADFMLARDLLTHAIELDPDYAPAHAWLAYWSIMAVGQGWVQNPQDVTALAGASADRAVALDPMDARALAVAGHVKGYLLHDVPGALRLHERAVELNPNLQIAWTLSSCSKIYNGEHAVAIQHATTAQALSPRDPHIFFVEHQLMTAQFFSHHLEEACIMSESVLQRNPGHASALNVRLAILGHLGRRDEALVSLKALQSIDPNVSVSKITSRAPLRPEDKAYYIEGLERAGVPR